MSIAMHVQAFENKTFSRFKRSIAWDVLGPKAIPSVGAWDLIYDGRRGGKLMLDDDELITGCSVRNPSENAIRDLYAVAQQVPSVLNLFGDFFFADARFLAGFPDFLLNDLPQPPRLVLSADELLEHLPGW
jgi:hypothetical protein